MSDQAIVRIATRTAALEYLFTAFATEFYRTTMVDPAAIAWRHRMIVEALNDTTVPDVGPAMSDHLAAEVQIAVEEILRTIEENVASPTRSRRP